MRRGIKMIAGLPGTGIGGLFYMLMALQMLSSEAINIMRGRARLENAQLIKNHLILTSCIIIAVIAAGWLAGLLAIAILFGLHGVSDPRQAQIENFLQLAPIILTFITLLAVYLAMHALRLFIRVHKFLS